MQGILRNLFCREFGLGAAILICWLILSTEQVVGVVLCLVVSLSVNALLNQIVDRNTLDEE